MLMVAIHPSSMTEVAVPIRGRETGSSVFEMRRLLGESDGKSVEPLVRPSLGQLLVVPRVQSLGSLDT